MLEARTLLALAAATELFGKWQEGPGPQLKEYDEAPVVEIGWHDNIVPAGPFAPDVSADHQQTNTVVRRIGRTDVPMAGRSADYYRDSEGLTSGLTYQYQIIAQDNDQATPDEESEIVSATSWAMANIGSATGTGSSDGHTVSLETTGSGFPAGTTNPDSTRFVYRTLTGDGQIVARFTGGSHAGDRGGITFRETSSLTSPSPDNAKHITLTTGSTGTVGIYRRSATGGLTDTPTLGAGTGQWLKLVREGNRFTGYVSQNGITWTQVWQDYFSMAAQLPRWGW
jgi:hypothetical protein